MTVVTGEGAAAMVLGQHTPLGAHLVAAGLVTAAEVDAALEEQRRTGKRLGEILIAQGVLYEADLAGALAAMFELPYRDLSQDPPDRAAIDEIPEAFCRSRGVMPVDFEDGCCRRRHVRSEGHPDPGRSHDDDAQPVHFVVVAPDQLRQAMETGFQALDLLEDEDERGRRRDARGRAARSRTSTRHPISTCPSPRDRSSRS